MHVDQNPGLQRVISNSPLSATETRPVTESLRVVRTELPQG